MVAGGGRRWWGCLPVDCKMVCKIVCKMVAGGGRWVGIDKLLSLWYIVVIDILCHWYNFSLTLIVLSLIYFVFDINCHWYTVVIDILLSLVCCCHWYTVVIDEDVMVCKSARWCAGVQDGVPGVEILRPRWCAGVQDGVQESRSPAQCGWDGGSAAEDDDEMLQRMMKSWWWRPMYVCCWWWGDGNVLLMMRRRQCMKVRRSARWCAGVTSTWWFVTACLKYAVEDEMNLCILSEGKRMLEPNSDLIGEFRRQRHRVLDLFLLLTVCLFIICIIGWSCSSRVW